MRLMQHLRPTGHTQETQSSLGLLGIVRCSMRLYLHKRQQPSVAGLLSFLDVSSLNSAAPHGAALFLPTPGGRVACPSSTVCRTGSTVHTTSNRTLVCRATVRTPRSATISDTSISSRPSLTEPPSSPKPPSGGGLKGQALRGFGQGGQSETDATISVIVTFNAGSSDCRAQAGSDCRATPTARRVVSQAPPSR